MIVVTGATGNVGRPLVRALAAAGRTVTAVSRRPTADGLPAGVRAVAADLARPTDLKPVLQGAEAMFLLLTGELLASDPSGLLAAASDAGVRRVVLLSSQGVGSRRYPPHIEEAVKASAPEWTVLRPSGYHTNALAWAPLVRGERRVAAPFGDVGLPIVDPVDVAEVAALALTGRGHVGATYALTGPDLVTPRLQAAAIGDAIGEPVRFVELSRDAARSRMLEFMPEPAVNATLAILGDPTPSEREISQDVERLLGRPGHTFAGWAERNRDAFR